MENDQLELNFNTREDPKKESKEERNEREKRELLESVIAGNIRTTKERVAYILNINSLSRNSDIDLAWEYWSLFEPENFSNHISSKEQLRKLTGIGTLTRSRAKIQNEYKLFQADDDVKRYRGVLEAEKREEAIEDKPSGLPIYSVFIDEAGKTQDYLTVGSLWLIDGGLSAVKTNRALQEWKELNKINYEFHFAEVTKNKLQSYKDFFLKFLGLNPSIGFKAIMNKNTGFKDTFIPLTELTFLLIHKGVLHEDQTGRAILPRLLSIWLDEDDKGSDKLKIENIKERIIRQKIPGLHLGNIESISSKQNFFVQSVDLFTSSINRKLVSIRRHTG